MSCNFIIIRNITDNFYHRVIKKKSMFSTPANDTESMNTAIFDNMHKILILIIIAVANVVLIYMNSIALCYIFTMTILRNKTRETIFKMSQIVLTVREKRKADN